MSQAGLRGTAARADLRQALAIREATLPPNHPDIQAARGNLEFLEGKG
jgi:hypothetical protein